MPLFIEVKQGGERVHVKAIGLKEVHAPESVLGHLNHSMLMKQWFGR